MSMKNDRDIAALQRKSEEMSLAIARLTKQVEKLKAPKKRKPRKPQTLRIPEPEKDAAVNG